MSVQELEQRFNILERFANGSQLLGVEVRYDRCKPNVVPGAWITREAAPCCLSARFAPETVPQRQ